MKKQVGALARRINGYKGRIKLDLAKLDTNFTTLQGSPASFIQLEQVRRHFKHVDSSVQLARELYITVRASSMTDRANCTLNCFWDSYCYKGKAASTMSKRKNFSLSNNYF